MGRSSGLQAILERFSHRVTLWVGSSWAFAIAVAAVVVWAASGPLFDYSDTWQLVINTSTTVVTFLVVFLIAAQPEQGLARAAHQAERDRRGARRREQSADRRGGSDRGRAAHARTRTSRSSPRWRGATPRSRAHTRSRKPRRGTRRSSREGAGRPDLRLTDVVLPGLARRATDDARGLAAEGLDAQLVVVVVDHDLADTSLAQRLEPTRPQPPPVARRRARTTRRRACRRRPCRCRSHCACRARGTGTTARAPRGRRAPRPRRSCRPAPARPGRAVPPRRHGRCEPRASFRHPGVAVSLRRDSSAWSGQLRRALLGALAEASSRIGIGGCTAAPDPAPARASALAGVRNLLLRSDRAQAPP